MLLRSLLLLAFILPFIGCADPSFKLREVSEEKPLGEAAPKETPLAVATPVVIPAQTQAATPVTTPGPVAAAKSPVPIAQPKADVFDTDVIKFRISEENWKKISDDDGVQAYQERNAKTDVVAFRGETIIPAPLQKVAAVLSDFNLRKEWVDALVEARILNQISRLESIEYSHTKVPWPFQDRDFVYHVLVKVNKFPATMLITMDTVENAMEPVQSGIVRGQIVRSYYYMQEIPGATPSTKLVIEMALDPKGAIPLWLVNATQKRWPHNTMMALKRITMRPNIVIPKDISDFFINSPASTPKTKKIR